LICVATDETEDRIVISTNSGAIDFHFFNRIDPQADLERPMIELFWEAAGNLTWVDFRTGSCGLIPAFCVFAIRSGGHEKDHLRSEKADMAT